MAGKSQELIQKLLKAEEDAEKIISNAREQRARKLRDVRQTAEEELEPFRAKEEEKFLQEQAVSGQAHSTAELDANTQRELATVKNDFESNKKNAIKYILEKVLDIDLTMPDNIKQQVMLGAI